MINWIKFDENHPLNNSYIRCGIEFLVIYNYGDGVNFIEKAIWGEKGWDIESQNGCGQCNCDCERYLYHGVDCTVTHYSRIQYPREYNRN